MDSITIRTGGQTGVDRAALDYALRHEIAYAGWCPRGGWAEDFREPPGVLARYPRLTETPSKETWQRTAWNARDSHLTLVLVRKGMPSEGTSFTLRCAELVFMRPCLVVELDESSAVTVAQDWLSQKIAGIGVRDLVLNIAGPRESEANGVYQQANAFLEDLQLVSRMPRKQSRTNYTDGL